MKIDLLYEIQIPEPHDARSEYRAFWEALEQIEAADRAGFSTVWAVEHHFLKEFAPPRLPRSFSRLRPCGRSASASATG